MDDERFQRVERRLNEQAEATQAMNKTLNMFITITSNIEVAKNIAPPAPYPPQLVTTILRASQPSRVNQASPVTLMGTECKGMLSSHPVSFIFHSQHQTSLMSKCASIGLYSTSRMDMWRASPSTFYSRRYGQERCALSPGVTS
jgi:hypothetical protein